MLRKVMIATPAYDFKADVHYIHSLVQTVAYLANKGIAAYPVFWPGEALVQHARNALAKLALEAKVDEVLFIDNDQDWLPVHAVKLMTHQVDVVGAPVRKKNDRLEEYNVRSVRFPIPTDPKTGLLAVDAVGTGFLRITRAALQAVWERSDSYQKSGDTFRMIFDVVVRDGLLWGEDTVLCGKLADAGIQVYVDPSFTVTHNGFKRYTGDFAAYLKRLAAKEPVAKE